MNRQHFFEWEDQPWFPSLLRDCGTDFLYFLAARTGMFLPALPLLERMLQQSQAKAVVDLASGAGGGLAALQAPLSERFPGLELLLTDQYPHQQAQHPGMRYWLDPVDARQIPAGLKGVRTMFLSFHHFSPPDAQAILQQAVTDGVPIGIFEAQERRLPSMLAMAFSPLTLWAVTPFLRPFRLSRLLLTYLLPLVPAFVVWDGIVSALRTYSVDEMQALIAQVEGHERFDWEVGRLPSGPGCLLYLVGIPRA